MGVKQSKVKKGEVKCWSLFLLLPGGASSVLFPFGQCCIPFLPFGGVLLSPLGWWRVLLPPFGMKWKISSARYGKVKLFDCNSQYRVCKDMVTNSINPQQWTGHGPIFSTCQKTVWRWLELVMRVAVFSCSVPSWMFSFGTVEKSDPWQSCRLLEPLPAHGAQNAPVHKPIDS